MIPFRGVTLLASVMAALPSLALFTPPARNASPPQRRPAAELDEILTLGVDWVESFERELAAVVAEERYEQRQESPRAARIIRSDLMLLRRADSSGWITFRDVFEVNRRAVRDRDDRLRKLFLDTPSTALKDAARINQESSRYNLGAVIRTINVPTFGLICLETALFPRFTFKRLGEETLDGLQTWRVAFVEQRGPTIVKTLRGIDVPIEGSLWIVPSSGRVIRTLVKTAGTQDPDQRVPPLDGTALMWMLTHYSADQQTGAWVPARMQEWARASNGVVVTGTADYSNFRRFQVSTSEMYGPGNR